VKSHYYNALTNLVSENEDCIAVLDGWPKKELQNILDNDFNVLSPESFFNQCVLGDYDAKWFTPLFAKLSSPGQHVVTLAQFIRLTSIIDSSVFAARATILSEGLRTYFPLHKEEFLEAFEQEGLIQRDSRLPSHHIEHLKIGDQHYFVQGYNLPIDRIEIFNESRELKNEREVNAIVIDTTNDRLELDLAISDFLEGSGASPIHVVYSPRHPLSNEYITVLERLNYLGHFRGFRISLGVKSNRVEMPPVSDRSKKLLKKYWGNKADFRNLKVYEDPDVSNNQIEISQGQIVDLIINEVDQGRKGNMPRDIFLTAPTGSGKSLLFQIPAFYTSDLGDVIIIVSPLIALMKDQVTAVHTDRGFLKAAYINSELSFMDREKVIAQTHSGEIDILYLSPELLLSYSIEHFLGERKLSLVIIDEAHLITTWGRDFRVDYWFLGNHLRKIKKYGGLTFPLVAVTATAVYGGMNDMVFDTLSSLEMNNPHVFIGSVRRDDISFAITNTAIQAKGIKFDNWKITQTVDFVLQLSSNSGLKTIVYAPYTKHVKQIHQMVTVQNDGTASLYYGGLDADLKEESYQKFMNGESKTMICTKAFGMGIDISDIQVVYHHAPSGHLPDYIQEVGRLARKPELKGWAALNYSEQDKVYMNRLFGMSSLKHLEVRDVLKKLYSKYLQTNRQNLLLSVDDFSHIFDSAIDLDQKVLTALMMIEKDYLQKYRFNVVIARPKKLFVKVFARIQQQHFDAFRKDFGACFKELRYDRMNERGFHVVSLDLDTLWKEHFEDVNFPTLKYKFYSGRLFDSSRYEVVPQLKIEIELLKSLEETLKEFDKSISSLREAFSTLQGKFFTQSDLESALKSSNAKKVAKYILNAYSSNLDGFTGTIFDRDSFLQKRRTGDKETYRLFSRAFEKEFATLRKRLNNLFGNGNNKSIRYMTFKDNGASLLFRLGQWMEIEDLGSYNASGGEKPMIFIRLNDPKKLEKDSTGYYKNDLLERTRDKHGVSTTIFDHFFQNSFDDTQRWDFVEDFFLGTEVDDLLEKYPPSEKGNHMNLVSTISKLAPEEVQIEKVKKSTSIFRKESEAGWYGLDDSITIEIDGKLVSKKFSRWVTHDVVMLHKFIEAKGIRLNKDAFAILTSKLRQNKPYFTKIQGVKKRIPFHGYDGSVQVAVLLKDNPVKFYKWWVKNIEEVHLPLKDKLSLLLKVRSQGERLTKEHNEYVSRFGK